MNVPLGCFINYNNNHCTVDTLYSHFTYSFCVQGIKLSMFEPTAKLLMGQPCFGLSALLFPSRSPRLTFLFSPSVYSNFVGLEHTHFVLSQFRHYFLKGRKELRNYKLFNLNLHLKWLDSSKENIRFLIQKKIGVVYSIIGLTSYLNSKSLPMRIK